MTAPKLQNTPSLEPQAIEEKLVLTEDERKRRVAAALERTLADNAEIFRRLAK